MSLGSRDEDREVDRAQHLLCREAEEELVGLLLGLEGWRIAAATFREPQRI